MTSYQLDPAAPLRLGRYELIGHLATGGMAEIHLARLAGEAGFEKIVVIKRLLPELVASKQFVAMFLDEARLVARLDHPNVCEVHELGRDGAEYFIAMPYLDGIPTTELIARPRDPDRRAQLRVAAGVIAQACAGLHHAHELRDAAGEPLGIVHRDVSPSNLFVTATGAVKVLDFGVAKVRGATETEAGTIKGKTQYMAPEQVLGEALDRRCDIFALGIVLYELATHQRLFKRSSDYLTARAILEEPIPRADAADPAIPAVLADVIAKALTREASGRYADAAALAAAITTAIDIASPDEIAATVRGGEELSAMRTRQARVLDGAKAIATAAAPPAQPTAVRTTVDRPRRRVTVWIVPALGIGVAIIAVAIGGRRAPPEVESPAPVAAAAPPIDGGAPDATPHAAAPPDDAAVAAPDAGFDAVPAPAPVTHPARPAAAGAFSIDSKPYATIFVDGKPLGVTPIVKRALPAGRHRLRAVLEDGRARELAVDVPSGRAAPPILLSW